ncbi:hypothetical protein NT2_06_00290 [Caenibius tardaugens NBRC 16725]|uniref:DUF2029 domain-containing protein n=1 Tax=Caenibius tardaugens NBRC 16725 TaxID=1219035 RepID=U2YLN9_9SPHN|nr:glycosyltransferase family 87 protein [Caenibius tardaugens]AZI37832.1 DUF2029 domain-containing protein [Caenibius tardaugens NBRC 16725]GAD49590.1 hypothetical protein NT2_06_00290 [Caenibius tardaugens NBRC 16725]
MGIDFFQNADWLNRERIRRYLAIFAALNVGTLALLVATAHDGIDRNGFLIGSDFLSFWTVGHMLLGQNPAAVYNTVAHVLAQREFYVQEGTYTAFFYPPSFLLFCYPFGFLSYFPALITWIGATGLAWLWTVRQWLKVFSLTPSVWLLALAFPPSLITITHGQTSFLIAALLGYGTLKVRERPAIAGICFGLATIKPQFGVLIPLVLVLTGEWRVILVAGATAIAMALAAALAFGPETWLAWMAISENAQAAMTNGAVGFAKMQSPLAAARLLGMPVTVAYAAQIVIVGGVVLALVRACWQQTYNLSLGAAMLAGAPLTTPFVLDYDLTILVFPLIALAANPTHRPWEKIIIAAAFAAPAFSRPLAIYIGIPIMPLVLIALFTIAARRAITERTSMATAPV